MIKMMELDESLSKTILKAAGEYFTKTHPFTQSLKLTTTLSVIVDCDKQYDYVACDEIYRGDAVFYVEDASQNKQTDRTTCKLETDIDGMCEPDGNLKENDLTDGEANTGDNTLDNNEADGDDAGDLDDNESSAESASSSPREWICPVCTEYCPSFVKLSLHVVMEHEHCLDKEYKCKLCNKECFNLQVFSKHWSEEHKTLRTEETKSGNRIGQKECLKTVTKARARLVKIKKKLPPRKTRMSKRGVPMIYESADNESSDEYSDTLDGSFDAKEELTDSNRIESNETPTDYTNRDKHANKKSQSIDCTLCDKKYLTLKACRRHYSVKHQNKIHPCDMCEKAFNSKESLYHHKRGIHSDVKAYQCTEPNCYASFNFNHSLKLHKLKHSGSRPHECSLCGKTYLTSHHLKVHQKGVHAKEKEYTCKTCGKLFSYMTSLRMHEAAHVSKSRVACDKCDKTFVNKQALKYHNMSKHMDKGNYKCDKCDKVYSTELLLKAHIRRHVRDNNRFMCDICGRQFMYKSALEMHKSVHRDDKAFICKTCSKSFKTYATLYSHMIVHREDTPFKCDQCEKAFKTKERMKAHAKRHAGLKPFRCELCSHTFPDKGGLSKHMKTVHCPVKKFVCDICGKSTARADNLRVHMKVHSKGTIKPTMTVESRLSIDDLPSNVPLVIAESTETFSPVKKQQRKPRLYTKAQSVQRNAVPGAAGNTREQYFQSNMPHFSTIDSSQISVSMHIASNKLQTSASASPVDSIPAHIANENMVDVDYNNRQDKEQVPMTIAHVPSTVTSDTISVAPMQPVNYMYQWPTYVYTQGSQQAGASQGFYQEQ